MKIKKSELKQIIKESVKQVLREGAGSAYELKIDGLCVDKINILHKKHSNDIILNYFIDETIMIVVVQMAFIMMVI